jgi:hypothetical protein
LNLLIHKWYSVVYILMYTTIGIYCGIKLYIVWRSMRKITLSLPEELENELRQRTEVDYAGIKGGLSIVVIQALREWFKDHPREQI